MKIENDLCKKAKLQAGIKSTAFCLAIDKENSIESLLDLLHYIYNYYCSYTPCLPQSSCPSADFFFTCCDYDLWLCMWHDHNVTILWPLLYLCDSVTVMWYFPCSTLVIT